MIRKLLTLLIVGLIPSGCSESEPEDTTSLHPDFPVVEGTYQITKNWKLTLPGKYNRRIEDGDLVIWRPGFTIWTVVWGNDKNQTLTERLEWLKGSSSPEAYDEEVEQGDQIIRYSYRLAEESDNDRQAALYYFVIGETGHVQIAVYFDKSEDLNTAKDICRSLIEQAVEN